MGRHTPTYAFVHSLLHLPTNTLHCTTCTLLLHINPNHYYTSLLPSLLQYLTNFTMTPRYHICTSLHPPSLYCNHSIHSIAVLFEEAEHKLMTFDKLGATQEMHEPLPTAGGGEPVRYGRMRALIIHLIITR